MQRRENVTNVNSEIREMNKKKILSYLRKHSPVSRNIMCKEVDLSPATGTRIVEQLIAEGLVKETKQLVTSLEKVKEKKGAGRSPVDLELNADAGYCFGINLSKHTLGIALVDFCLNITSQYVTAISDIDSAQELLELIGNTIDEMMKSRRISKDKILGLGVGTPGFVDMENGKVMNFAITKFAVLPIKQYLTSRFHIPVIVDNNANTRMLGEFWNGYAVNCKSAVFVINNEGVGSGILYHGHILKDTNHFSAGLGHISVDFEGEVCGCGSKGCVELYCGTEYLEVKAQQILGEGKALSYKDIARRASDGDERLLGLLETAANAMSSGLTSLITIVCPEVIILSGTLFDASDYYYQRVVELTKEKTGIVMKKVEFHRRRVKDSIYEIGAAALFFQKYYEE